MKKYGFVYLWRDKKTNMFYVGSHWGNEHDGYICSSRWMLNAFSNRPNDFKRRILKKIFTNRADLLTEEQRWLDMIKLSEITKHNKTDLDRIANVRYYNLNLCVNENIWHSDDEQIKTIGQKISAAKKGKKLGPCSPEKAKAISEAKKASFERKQQELGYKFSNEHIEKITESRKGYNHSEEWKQENSRRMKELWASDDYTNLGNTGKPQTDNQKRAVSEALKGREKSPEHKEKIRQANINRSSDISNGLKARWADPIWAANQREKLKIAAKKRHEKKT